MVAGGVAGGVVLGELLAIGGDVAVVLDFHTIGNGVATTCGGTCATCGGTCATCVTRGSVVNGCGGGGTRGPNNSARLSEWKFSISWMNFSSSNRNSLNGFVLILGVLLALGPPSFSGGRATPTPVSDGTKSGGGNLGSLKSCFEKFY